MNLHKPSLFTCCLLILVGCSITKNKDVLLPPNIAVKKASVNRSRLVVIPPAKTNITISWSYPQSALQWGTVFALEHSQDLKTWNNLTNFSVPLNPTNSNWIYQTNYSMTVPKAGDKDFFRVGVRYLTIVR